MRSQSSRQFSATPSNGSAFHEKVAACHARLYKKYFLQDNFLEGLQLVLILDSSKSMREQDADASGLGRAASGLGRVQKGSWTRWDNACEIVSFLAETIFAVDDDNEVPVVVFGKEKYKRHVLKNMDQLQKLLDVTSPAKTETFEHGSLAKALERAFHADTWNRADRTLFVVFTDGRFDDKERLCIKNVIRGTVCESDPEGERHKILMVRHGDDSGAIQFLTDLDNCRETGNNVDHKSDNAVFALGPKNLLMNAFLEHMDHEVKAFEFENNLTATTFAHDWLKKDVEATQLEASRKIQVKDVPDGNSGPTQQVTDNETTLPKWLEIQTLDKRSYRLSDLSRLSEELTLDRLVELLKQRVGEKNWTGRLLWEGNPDFDPQKLPSGAILIWDGAKAFAPLTGFAPDVEPGNVKIVIATVAVTTLWLLLPLGLGWLQYLFAIVTLMAVWNRYGCGAYQKIVWKKHRNAEFFKAQDAVDLIPREVLLGKRGLRVLSISGGGSRGVIALEVLEKLQNEICGDAGGQIKDKFDLICGTSTGGLIALWLAYEKRVQFSGHAENSMYSRYRSLSSRLFGVWTFLKLARLLGTLARYSPLPLYDFARHIGRDEVLGMPDGRTRPLLFVTSISARETKLLSNYRLDSADHMLIPEVNVVAAALATAAAPTYFPPVHWSSHEFFDGGFGANNPVFLAAQQITAIKNSARARTGQNIAIDAVVSIGTGSSSGKVVVERGVWALLKYSLDYVTNSDVQLEQAQRELGQDKVFSFNPVIDTPALDFFDDNTFEVLISKAKSHMASEKQRIESLREIFNIDRTRKA